MRISRLLLFLILWSALIVLSPITIASQNPLPAPTNPLLFGYYWVGPSIDDVSCYTNLCRIAVINNDAPDYETLTQYIGAARERNMHIILALHMATNCKDKPETDHEDPCKLKDKDDDFVSKALLAAKGYWKDIEYIELADEPGWYTKEAINLRIQKVYDVAAANQMSMDNKKIGFSSKTELISPIDVANSNLNYISVEAYLTKDDYKAGICRNSQKIKENLDPIIKNVGNKEVFIVMMSFDLSGDWKDISQLADLQNMTYLYALTKPKVKGLTMFAYQREGGAKDYPDLIAAHKQIGERILGIPPHPTCGSGETAYIPLPDCAPQAPSAPSDLVATARGNLVDLTWLDNSSDEAGFEIDRKLGGSGEWDYLTTVDADQTIFTDNSPPPSGDTPLTYAYRVLAFSSAGLSDYSNVARITLYADAPSDIPTLIAPIGCVNTLRPTFSWNPVARATRYYLVASAPDGDYPIDDSNVQGTSYTSPVDLTALKQYRWKVKACNNMGCTAYAPLTHFTPFCTLASPPVILSPAGCVTTRKPTITWTAIPGATYYSMVLMRQDPTATVTIYNNKTVTGTSFTLPANLVAGREHRIKIKAMSSTVIGPYSNYRYFTPLCTANQKPGTASPLTPGGNINLTNPTPSFSFEAASLATDYELIVKTTSSLMVFDNSYPADSICGTADCTITSPVTLPVGSYTWQIQSINANGRSSSLTPKFSIVNQ